jgi:hypothetical protein
VAAQIMTAERSAASRRVCRVSSRSAVSPVTMTGPVVVREWMSRTSLCAAAVLGSSRVATSNHVPRPGPARSVADLRLAPGAGAVGLPRTVAEDAGGA